MKKKERLKRFQKMTDSYIRKVYKKAGVFPLVIDTDESLSFKDEGRKITVNISYSTGSGFFFGKILKDYIPGNEFSNERDSLGRYYFEGDDYKELVKNFKKAVRHYKVDKQLVEALLEDSVIVEDGFAVIPFLTTAEESEDGDIGEHEHYVIIINLYDVAQAALVHLNEEEVIANHMRSDEVLEKALKVIHSNAEIITLHMDEKFMIEKDCYCSRCCLFPDSDEFEDGEHEAVAEEEPVESEKQEPEEPAKDDFADAFESEEEDIFGTETDDIFVSKSDSKEDDIFGSEEDIFASL